MIVQVQIAASGEKSNLSFVTTLRMLTKYESNLQAEHNDLQVQTAESGEKSNHLFLITHLILEC